MNNKFFVETLPKNTAHLIKVFQDKKPDFLKDFYLSGGTALSLQIGHRESEDLDFFSKESFSPQKLQHNLLEYGKLEQTELAEGTVNTFLNGVKLQFLEYHYNLIKPLTKWGSIKLSSIQDIACTKLQTIGARGNKKDFIDLYCLLDKYSLSRLFKLMEKKYEKIEYSKTHIMKSLVYFKDAEQQPMPRMHKDISWEEVKNKIIRTVRAVKFD
jgi:predicted nucleotidyltransferase component of viral defense system